MLKLNPLKVFEVNVVQQVIDEAIAILQDPGIQVHNREALRLLKEAGAKEIGASASVSISESLVHQALESAPHEFDLYDMTGRAVVHYGGNHVHFDPGSAGVTVLDMETQKHRPPITRDFVTFVKLVEVLPALDAQSTAMVCQDVAEEIGDLYRLYIALNYMHKPIITGAFRKDTWWTMRELLIVVRGSEEELRQKPLAVFDVCPSPPLMWSDLTCQNLIDCARNFIPAQIVSMPLAGATAPVTLAGAVVQHAAECLSGIVIHQLAQPGAPIVWGGSPAAFDMRYGTTPMGAAETWLIDLGYVQIGKALGLPTHVYMGMSDTKVVDAQCGLESMGGTLMATLCGANMVSGAGMLDYETCLSLEKLVIDAEIINLAKRVAEGIAIREQPMASEIIRQAGHQGAFLSLPHTRRWFRQELSAPSKVIDRNSLDGWIASGAKSTHERAREAVNEWLQKYTPNTLSSEARRELFAITLSIAKKFGMSALPSIEETS